MLLQPGEVADLRHFPRFLHRTIPRPLTLGHRPGLCRRAPTKDWTVGIVLDARELRGHAKSDASTPHLRQANRSASAIRLVFHGLLTLAQLGDGLCEVAIPFDRV